jgi:hypothetical protein
MNVRAALIVPAASIMLAATLSACGSDEPAVMPDVTTRRLDIALSDIEKAGFEDEVEVLGGGTFGILDESNWTVCDQEPAAGDDLSTAPRLVVDRACENEDDLEGEAEPEPQADAEPEAQPESEPEPEPEPEQQKAAGSSSGNKGGDGTDETFVMPSVVGLVLQDAQDQLQARGSFLLTQTDATGMERFQVDDSNWKVCAQFPAAGKRVSLGKLIDLHTVKLDEVCP